MNNLSSDFNAFGKDVLPKRIERARLWLENEFPNLGPFPKGFILGCAVRGIKNDRPAGIFEDLRPHLDETAIYRLIAILCTDESIEENQYIPATKICECSCTRTIENGICNVCGGFGQW